MVRILTTNICCVFVWLLKSLAGFSNMLGFVIGCRQPADCVLYNATSYTEFIGCLQLAGYAVLMVTQWLGSVLVLGLPTTYV